VNLVAMQIEENRRNRKITVLRREGHTWHEAEVAKLCNGLNTEVSGHPQHPEYLILCGHHTKEQTLQALVGGQAYTATQITGLKSEGVPFIPGFAG